MLDVKSAVMSKLLFTIMSPATVCARVPQVTKCPQCDLCSQQECVKALHTQRHCCQAHQGMSAFVHCEPPTCSPANESSEVSAVAMTCAQVHLHH